MCLNEALYPTDKRVNWITGELKSCEINRFQFFQISLSLGMKMKNKWSVYKVLMCVFSFTSLSDCLSTVWCNLKDCKYVMMSSLCDRHWGLTFTTYLWNICEFTVKKNKNWITENVYWFNTGWTSSLWMCRTIYLLFHLLLLLLNASDSEVLGCFTVRRPVWNNTETFNKLILS